MYFDYSTFPILKHLYQRNVRIRRGNFHQDHGIEFGETKNRKIKEKKKKEEEKKGKEKEKKEKGKNMYIESVFRYNIRLRSIKHVYATT